MSPEYLRLHYLRILIQPIKNAYPFDTLSFQSRKRSLMSFADDPSHKRRRVMFDIEDTSNSVDRIIQENLASVSQLLLEFAGGRQYEMYWVQS